MQERSFTTIELVAATSPVLSRLLLVWGAVALAKALLFYLFGLSGAQAIIFALLAGAVFFSAPLALSALRARRRVRLLSRSGRKTLLFCFVWGAISVALFIALLQITQGMGATAMNYLLAMMVAGLFCSATSSIPSGR